MAQVLKSVVKRLLPARLWTRLRLWKQARSLASYPVRDVHHTYGGIPLTVHLTDAMATGWYDHDWSEPPEFAVLMGGRLKPGARVFDLGAHQGVVALMLSKLVGPSGAVVAVEAHPHNVAAAKANRDRNGAHHLKIVHAAVSDAPGTITFSEGLNGSVDDGAAGWGRIEVPAMTVDGLAAEHGPPDVLYIDVEGFECQVLKGATATLAQRPDAFVEMHVGHGLEKFGGSIDAVLSFFPASEYDHFMAEENAPYVPFRRDSPIMKTRFFFVARHRKTANPG